MVKAECLNCSLMYSGFVVRWLVYSFLIAVLFVSSCVSTGSGDSSLVWRLNNRGPLALSSDNPFLAANLFVSTLAESSPILSGFLKHRGVPPAVEVVSGYFKEPVVHLYYPENREYFVAEGSTGDWVINGPDRILPDKLKEVLYVTNSYKGTPVLRVQEYPTLARANADAFQESESELEREKDHQGAFRSVRGESFQGSSVDPRDSSELKVQQALQNMQQHESTKGVEMTPRGDLVHYVTYNGETLSIIARWYTHDRANAGRLARINNLQNPDKLEIGDAVVIPSYLLRSKVPYTESEYKELMGIIHSNK